MKTFVAGFVGTLMLFGLTLMAAGGPAPGQDAAKIAEGQKVYAANKCRNCHAIDGKGMKKYPLDGIGTKLSADDIRMWITTPDEMRAKQDKKQSLKMKASKLSPAEVDALVAYMASLKK